MRGQAAAVVAVLLAFAAGWWCGSKRQESATLSAGDRSAGQGPSVEEREAPATRPRAKRPEAPSVAGGAPPDATSLAGADPTRPSGHLRTGRVTLLSRTKHDDYEKATFSFEHGIRDDPGLRITRNDWEIHFGGADVFTVRMVTDDTSTIADLGACESLDALLATSPAVADPTLTSVPAVAGHAYLVHSRDSESDHYSVLRVTELVLGDEVTFDWADWTPPPPAGRGALALAPGTRAGLAAMLANARSREAALRRERFGEMKDPSNLVLQLRTGAQGGNRSAVSFADPTTWGRVANSEVQIDAARPPATSDRATAFVRGGYLPEGRALVIEAVDVFATAAGDSNGDGEVVVSIRGEPLVQIRDDPGPLLDWFSGRAVVRPGEEHLVFVQIANSSVADVRLRGRFVPLAEADSIEPVPFWAGPAPAGAARAGGTAAAAARSSYLAEPRAVLQVRAGHGGGNPMRVNLLGASGGHLRQMSDVPIAAEAPEESSKKSESTGHLQGGRVPRGKAFVVTRVDFEARTTKGHGSASITVMGTTIASISRKEADDFTSGTWTGRLVVPAGSEDRVFVQASWFSFASATLTGELVDAR